MASTSTSHHDGPTVAHIHRALAADTRPLELKWRIDRQTSFRAVVKYLLVRADRGTLISRPSRALIARMTGYCERTVTARIADAIALGYITILEPGTTPRIRAGRCYPNPDPHAGEGNHAQVYQLQIPEQLRAEILEPYDTQEQASQPHVPAGQRRTCAPSTGTSSTRGKDFSTSVGATPTHTRARGTSCHDQRAGKPEKKKSPRPRQHAGRRLWLKHLDDVQAVWQALPTALTELLAGHEAPRIADAIAVELTHRSIDELAERITRHWSYWRYKVAAGLVRSPAAIAFRLIRRDFDCPDVRCEDRWQLDLDDECKACALRAEEIRAARRAARPGPRYSVPFEPTRPRPDAPRRPAHMACPAPAPVPATAPDRCDPNDEFRQAREALMRKLGAAGIRGRTSRTNRSA